MYQLDAVEQAGDKGFKGLLVLIDTWLREWDELTKAELDHKLMLNVRDVFYAKAPFALKKEQVEEIIKTIDDKQIREDFMNKLNAIDAVHEQAAVKLKDLENKLLESGLDANEKRRLIALFEDCRLSLYDPCLHTMPENVFTRFRQIAAQTEFLDRVTFLRTSDNTYIAMYPESMKEQAEAMILAAALDCGKYQHMTKDDLDASIAARAVNKLLASELRFENVPVEMAERALIEADKQGIVTFVKEQSKKGDKTCTLICNAGEAEEKRTKIYSEASRILACSAFVLSGKGKEIEQKRMKYSINTWNKLDEGINSIDRNGEKRGVVMTASFNEKLGRTHQTTVAKFNDKELELTYNNAVKDNIFRAKATVTHSEDEWKHIINLNTRNGQGFKFYLDDDEWKHVCLEGPQQVLGILRGGITSPEEAYEKYAEKMSEAKRASSSLGKAGNRYLSKAERNNLFETIKGSRADALAYLAAAYVLGSGENPNNKNCQEAYFDAVCKDKEFNNMSCGKEIYDRNQTDTDFIFKTTDKMMETGTIAFENPWSVRTSDEDKEERTARESVAILRKLARDPQYITDYLNGLYENAAKKDTEKAYEDAHNKESMLTDGILEEAKEVFHAEHPKTVTEARIAHILLDEEKSIPAKLKAIITLSESLTYEQSENTRSMVSDLQDKMMDAVQDHVDEAETNLGQIRVIENHLHLEPSILIEKTQYSREADGREEKFLEEAGIGTGVNPKDVLKARGVKIEDIDTKTPKEDDRSFTKNSPDETISY